MARKTIGRRTLRAYPAEYWHELAKAPKKKKAKPAKAAKKTEKTAAELQAEPLKKTPSSDENGGQS